MVCDINRIAKPAVLTQPAVKPEVVSMADDAEEEEAPKIELVPTEEAPAEEAPAAEEAPVEE